MGCRIATRNFLLRWRVAVKYRNWAEGSSHNLFLQGLIFAPLFVVTMSAFQACR